MTTHQAHTIIIALRLCNTREAVTAGCITTQTTDQTPEIVTEGALRHRNDTHLMVNYEQSLDLARQRHC